MRAAEISWPESRAHLLLIYVVCWGLVDWHLVNSFIGMGNTDEKTPNQWVGSEHNVVREV